MRGEGVEEPPCVDDACDAVALREVAEVAGDEEVRLGSLGAFQEAVVGFVGRVERRFTGWVVGRR